MSNFKCDICCNIKDWRWTKCFFFSCRKSFWSDKIEKVENGTWQKRRKTIIFSLSYVCYLWNFKNINALSNVKCDICCNIKDWRWMKCFFFSCQNSFWSDKRWEKIIIFSLMSIFNLWNFKNINALKSTYLLHKVSLLWLNYFFLNTYGLIWFQRMQNIAKCPF